ncbi:MAG: AAA family ATPase [Burkholderiaceae bacterium]
MGIEITGTLRDTPKLSPHELQLEQAIEFVTEAIRVAPNASRPTILFADFVLRSWAFLQRHAPADFSGLFAPLDHGVKQEILRRLRSLDAPGGAGDAPVAELPRFRFLTVDELIAQPTPTWLVLRVIPARGLVVLWGASGSGKTFVALDMAGAIVRGIQWAGRRTRRGMVAYIAAEGQLRERIEAYLERNELEPADLDGLRVLDSSINLLDPSADVDELIAALRELVAGGEPLAAVVIDTLNRAMPGADENSALDMGMVIQAAKRIERALGAVVMFVHHSGKEESKGSRGHSSLKAATDAELSVKRTDDDRTVTAEKVRDGADHEALLTFRLRTVDLGPMIDVDPEADPAERRTSCTVEPLELVRPPKVSGEPKGSNQRIVLAALRELVIECGEALPASSVIPPGTAGVELDALVRRVEPKIPAADAYRSRGRINEALSSLQAGGWVGVHKPYVWLA